MHLLKGICYIISRDLFLILEFQKFVSTVSGHIDEDIGVLIGVQSLRDRSIWACATYKQVMSIVTTIYTRVG